MHPIGAQTYSNNGNHTVNLVSVVEEPWQPLLLGEAPLGGTHFGLEGYFYVIRANSGNPGSALAWRIDASVHLGHPRSPQPNLSKFFQLKPTLSSRGTRNKLGPTTAMKWAFSVRWTLLFRQE